MPVLRVPKYDCEVFGEFVAVELRQLNKIYIFIKLNSRIKKTEPSLRVKRAFIINNCYYSIIIHMATRVFSSADRQYLIAFSSAVIPSLILCNNLSRD